MRIAVFLLLGTLLACEARWWRSHRRCPRLPGPPASKLIREMQDLNDCILRLDRAGVDFQIQRYPYSGHAYCLRKSRCRQFYKFLQFNLRRCESIQPPPPIPPTPPPPPRNFTDCYELLTAGFIYDGVYEITVNGTTHKVYCDMTTDGGGYLKFLIRNSQIEDFNRTLAEYAVGFGDPNKEYYAGNRLLHLLTSAGPRQLRVDMRDLTGNPGVSIYDIFQVDSEDLGFRLNVDGYNVALSSAGDALAVQTGERFQNYEDALPAIIEIVRSFGGGFWYSINSLAAPTTTTRGAIWFTFTFNPLASISMSIR